METHEIDQLLEQMLADFRLSRTERQALKLAFQELGADGQQLSAIRRRVFEVARQQVLSPESHAVLGWVEEVLRARQPPPDASVRTTEAYFSPDENCGGHILRLLQQAARQIDVCVFPSEPGLYQERPPRSPRSAW